MEGGQKQHMMRTSESCGGAGEGTARDSMMQETPPSLPAPDQMGKEGRAVKIGGRQVQV